MDFGNFWTQIYQNDVLNAFQALEICFAINCELYEAKFDILASKSQFFDNFSKMTRSTNQNFVSLERGALELYTGVRHA